MTAAVTVQLEDSSMKALIATLLLAGACASSGVHAGDEPPVASLLTVHNGRTDDETIYVVHEN